MKRLTLDNWRNLDPWECCGQDRYCIRPSNKQAGCRNGCIVPKLYDRLAQYEDTGFSPEEIKKERWIPCSERMPELIPCNAGTAYSEAVNVWTTGRKAMVGVWNGSYWIVPYDFWEAYGEKITHWQPIWPPVKGGSEDG